MKEGTAKAAQTNGNTSFLKLCLDQPKATHTSETADAAKAAERGHVFSKAFLEKAASDILCPAKDETVYEAIAAMEKICADALADQGAKWKSVVQDQDKFGLLVAPNHKTKIVFKTSMMLSVLAVIKSTLAQNLPPMFIKTCELTREHFMMLIGHENLHGVWIPQRNTIYAWFRDFRTGRVFTHPEIKLHEKRLLLENLDGLFAKHPDKLIAFVSHVKYTLRETNGVLIESSYSIYSSFASEIAGSATLKRILGESRSVGTLCSTSLNDQESLMESFKLEKLKWHHLYDWMEGNTFEYFEVNRRIA